MKAVGYRVKVLIAVLELSLYTRGELLRVADSAEALTAGMVARMHPLARAELVEVAEGSL